MGRTRERVTAHTMTASSAGARSRRYYKTPTNAITVSKATPICNTVTLFDLIDAERLKFLRRRRKPFRGRATFGWRAFCHIRTGQAMISKIIAVSVLGFSAIVTVAWTTFLGWGLYELLH